MDALALVRARGAASPPALPGRDEAAPRAGQRSGRRRVARPSTIHTGTHPAATSSAAGAVGARAPGATWVLAATALAPAPERAGAMTPVAAALARAALAGGGGGEAARIVADRAGARRGLGRSAPADECVIIKQQTTSDSSGIFICQG
jgi:hypothetical protein